MSQLAGFAARITKDGRHMLRCRNVGSHVHQRSRPIQNDVLLDRAYPETRRAIYGCVALSVLAAISLLSIPVSSAPSKLREETLAAWNDYVGWVRLRTEMHVKQSPFLWISEVPPRRAEVRSGNIPVWPQGTEYPVRVPYGLIHDWLGAVFIPKATISEVLAVTRNYDHYAEIYKPAVIDAKQLRSTGLDDTFSMTLMHRALFVTAALRGEYETHYVRLDVNHWYSISQGTRLQAIQHLYRPDMLVLPPDQGPGYIWRLYSFTKFEESDEGVYIESEALGLSRDVPLMFRWLVDPIVESLAKDSIRTTLEETRNAVLMKCSRTSDMPESRPIPKDARSEIVTP